MAEHLIELRNITKSFGSVYALGGVSLHVDPGEVVGLIGDNGAGKSTLIKILAGVIKPTSGEILVQRQGGQQLEPGALARGRDRDGLSGSRPRRAAVDRAQHLHGARTRRPLRLAQDTRRQIEEAERLMREIGFTSKVFSPRSIVGQLSGGERQGVAIARAILKDANLIVLDEPTTALSLTETAKVFHFVRQVREAGRSIIFIGHNIHHVYDIAERFVVIDRGKVAMEKPKSEVGSAAGAHRVHGRRGAAASTLKLGETA